MFLAKGTLDRSNEILDQESVPWISSKNKINFADFRKIQPPLKGSLPFMSSIKSTREVERKCTFMTFA